nr:retrovirus-related Pol polyprotein from transposon TNT 1-94 [Tanacetum cinerariifolium]
KAGKGWVGFGGKVRLKGIEFESNSNLSRAEIELLNESLPRDIYKLINHNTDAKDIWDNVKMSLEGSELTKDDRKSQLYDEFEHFGQYKGENIHDYYVRGDRTWFKETMLGVILLQEIREFRTELEKMLLMQAQENRVDLDEDQMVFLVGGQTNTFDDDVDEGPVEDMAQNKTIFFKLINPKRPHNFDYFKEKMLLMQAQENGVDLDEEKLLFLAGGQTNTFDDDVDDGLVQDIAQNEDNIFQANQCDAFDSDVQNHDNCLDDINEYHEELEMQHDVQPNDVVDMDNEYMSTSNIISYEQYVQDNEAPVVQSDASSVPNDIVMMVTNDIYEQDVPCVTSNQPNNTVYTSLTAELATYKELAEVYEKRLNLN